MEEIIIKYIRKTFSVNASNYHLIDKNNIYIYEDFLFELKKLFIVENDILIKIVGNELIKNKFELFVINYDVSFNDVFELKLDDELGYNTFILHGLEKEKWDCVRNQEYAKAAKFRHLQMKLGNLVRWG